MAYDVKWYPFTCHPVSDSCWSLSVGPDGRVYAAACCEYLPGGVVKVVRYNEEADAVDCLFDVDEVVDDPRDSGRATQCKIHYSFAPSMGDIGIVGGLDYLFFSGVGMEPAEGSDIPFVLFATFQMMFAAITPALISGAFAERKRFAAFVVFTIAWSILSLYAWAFATKNSAFSGSSSPIRSAIRFTASLAFSGSSQ